MYEIADEHMIAKQNIIAYNFSLLADSARTCYNGNKEEGTL